MICLCVLCYTLSIWPTLSNSASSEEAVDYICKEGKKNFVTAQLKAQSVKQV